MNTEPLVPVSTSDSWKTPPGDEWNLHRWAASREERAPVIFLHGFTGTGEDAEALVSELGQDRTWLAPDLPGHGGSVGLSSPHAYGAEAMTEGIVALCRQQAVRPILMGYSMGGRLAILVACAAPALLAGLILVGCGAGLSDPQARQQRARADETLANRLEQEGLSAFVADWESLPIIASQKRIAAPWGERLRKRRRQQSATELAKSLRAFGQGVAPALPATWAGIPLRRWHLAGSEDHLYRRRGAELMDGLEKSQVTVITDAGHAAHLENLPDSIVKIRQIFENCVENGPDSPKFT